MLGLKEFVEDEVVLGWGNAPAIVLHAQQHGIGGGPGQHPNMARPAGRASLHGIREQVDEHLHQPVVVSQQSG